MNEVTAPAAAPAPTQLKVSSLPRTRSNPYKVAVVFVRTVVRVIVPWESGRPLASFPFLPPPTRGTHN